MKLTIFEMIICSPISDDLEESPIPVDNPENSLAGKNELVSLISDSVSK